MGMLSSSAIGLRFAWPIFCAFCTMLRRQVPPPTPLTTACTLCGVNYNMLRKISYKFGKILWNKRIQKEYVINTSRQPYCWIFPVRSFLFKPCHGKKGFLQHCVPACRKQARTIAYIIPHWLRYCLVSPTLHCTSLWPHTVAGLWNKPSNFWMDSMQLLFQARGVAICIACIVLYRMFLQT